jgi:spore coat protein U-like protein
MHFALLIYFSNHPLHVSNRLNKHLQEAVTVCAAYGIYHASTVTSCWHDQSGTSSSGAELP